MLEEIISKKYNLLKPFLDEKSKRLFAAAEALSIGKGNISIVSRATGISENTIKKGCTELESGKSLSDDKIRAPGGGRKKIVEKDPTLLSDLEALIEPTSRGDPESPLLWTCKSLRNIAGELQNIGHKVSHTRVADMLHMLGYSLQANKKTIEGTEHPDRDKQFEHISEKCKIFQGEHQPVISVDTKKKELIGNFKNVGRELRPKKDPILVNVYDFKDKELGKVNPYGVYDIANNEGWVNVGIDHDTASFAVESIRRWWNLMGCKSYPDAKKLLITADCGGSNGSRVKLWKTELQKLTDEIGLEISVCHFPPGTSKWNKIEHRLFSQITLNWRGKPLTSYEVVVNLIAATTTSKGLEVKCMLDTNKYPTGIKIEKKQVEKLGIILDEFHGEWNYTFKPKNGVS
ncbi:MAG: ISAzo13 family transposase [Methanosarcina barkeri]|nr:ISAzo13 family transposase [Methanosarcina sp. ERenArc_MAG2]MCO5381719.1 ISAzo13 family transposase [Methanosarcina sp. ERenArc_MAG2]MCO5382005.1 ISAzo13 family transposase [Methanosarcina sp. ERenArc_MAG2]MCO5382277.1 ISAzo13 family transposase [Methanosarcina sp. ERenArc_MAG2]MCO5382323.1 ISAzo13 family transposase [Methanosarcina sp. ERenArc_MAG2]